ncbi:hypothetical protein VNO77_40541 [Canavalia gladiata]|uniref:Uncharacterized protein n=1 Tax=Canavalia gladiata TaxID=3824 RepID=A0AAN9PPN0_CANGL
MVASLCLVVRELKRMREEEECLKRTIKLPPLYYNIARPTSKIKHKSLLLQFIIIIKNEMEKLFKIKSTFFKFLSKQPVALVTFQNPILSPCRSPTQVVSIIPKEARRKHKGGSFSAREPSSPKVSCMGQVQGKKKRKTQKQKRVKIQQSPTQNNIDSVRCSEKKKILLWIPKGSDEARKQSGNLEEKTLDTLEAPSLNTMKKFASGRGALYDFDLTIAER